MIGVIAKPSERAVVAEFFELFKTPWEWFHSDRRYEVVLCTSYENIDASRAELVVLYAGHQVGSDSENLFETNAACGPAVLFHQQDRLPIYGDLVTFREAASASLREKGSGRPAMCRRVSGNRTLVRVGYDLFREIEHLLTDGQPAEFAHVPAIELHIALLREIILSAGLELIEVPPIPYGYQFVTCLTHDVDHPAITRHVWDHTIAGFLYRAVVGSLINLLRGRNGWREFMTNWAAAFRLPFVYLGLARDFWQGFDDRYLALEQGLSSTYFFIPFKDRAGKCAQGSAPKRRAARYSARELAGTICRIIAEGCEVGLHGIDAWLNLAAAREELDEIRRITGSPEVGARMHWLYSAQGSPAVLEQAGAAYDSTVGYRETVGYRAGTIQAYKPLNAQSLLELPLHVMDTALFYPAYMGLSSTQATSVLQGFTCDASRFGGCFTINWHDRSLAPERLWGACYRGVIDELKGRNAWFATAGQAAAWFRKRRSVIFESDDKTGDGVRTRIASDDGDELPSLRLRVYP
ncbi:MAG: hypothetical protein WA400_11985, partial [Silvibacterium sp.]